MFSFSPGRPLGGLQSVAGGLQAAAVFLGLLAEVADAQHRSCSESRMENE